MSSTMPTGNAPDAGYATDWIADATRRLVGLSAPGADAPAVDPRWGDDAIDRLRAAVSAQVSRLPRRVRPVATATPGVTVSQLALSRAVTAVLSADAAAESAAIADVELDVGRGELTGVHSHLVAVGADDREVGMLDGGERLRERVAAALEGIVGPTDVRVDLTWEDVLTRDRR